jgi:hypothetical protein
MKKVKDSVLYLFPYKYLDKVDEILRGDGFTHWNEKQSFII